MFTLVKEEGKIIMVQCAKDPHPHLLITLSSHNSHKY